MFHMHTIDECSNHLLASFHLLHKASLASLEVRKIEFWCPKCVCSKWTRNCSTSKNEKIYWPARLLAEWRRLPQRLPARYCSSLCFASTHSSPAVSPMLPQSLPCLWHLLDHVSACDWFIVGEWCASLCSFWSFWSPRLLKEVPSEVLGFVLPLKNSGGGALQLRFFHCFYF